MTSEARIIPFDTEWPGTALPVMPGDFSRFVSEGPGLSVLPPVTPYRSIGESAAAAGYYGAQSRVGNPILDAPAQYSAGGVIYFGKRHETSAILSALRVMGVALHRKDFVVFHGSSADPQTDRYADQARIMSVQALRNFFKPGAAAVDLPPQPATIGDYVGQFMAEQSAKWDREGTPFTPSMYGMFGGDGDVAKESLCYGFLVENAYWSVYRIWSRAELVTK